MIVRLCKINLSTAQNNSCHMSEVNRRRHIAKKYQVIQTQDWHEALNTVCA